MEWSWTTWFISVLAVVVSGALAALQHNFTRRPGLDMGFVQHGGMWGDLLLLPIANAVIVPHLAAGPWIPAALSIALALSVRVHAHWYRGDRTVTDVRSRAHGSEHMWPSRPHGSWWRDLSWAGWAHVAYVAGELTILTGFLLFPVPAAAVAVCCAVFTLHVPLGLLQPRWYLTGEIAPVRQHPLLLTLLSVLWVVSFVKI